MRAPAAHAAANCIPNVDGNDDIAAVVIPPGTFSGTLDASGCVFGIYVGPGHIANIKNADLFGAIDSNIEIDGSANITDSQLTGAETGITVGDNQAAQATITATSLPTPALMALMRKMKARLW